MIDCMDLRPWADARRYRWRYEEGYRPAGQPDEDKWRVEVICQRGCLIYPWGTGKLLALCSQNQKMKVRKIPGVEHYQWEDPGREALMFPESELDRVAEILKPKKKRKFTSEQARRLGASTAFVPVRRPAQTESE